MQHRFSIKRKTRPVRKSLEIVAVESNADALSGTYLRDEDVVVEEEDVDDIDPIDSRIPRSGGTPANGINSLGQVNLGNHPNDAISDLPDRLCCIAYSRMVAKHPKGKTIVPEVLFEKMGHKEAFPGEWEQYRQLGMSLIEGMMKIGDPTADLPPAPRRLISPTRAKI
jgi:hypothetical protein